MKKTGKGNERFSKRQREILIVLADTMLPPDVGTPFNATENNLISIPLEGKTYRAVTRMYGRL